MRHSFEIPLLIAAGLGLAVCLFTMPVFTILLVGAWVGLFFYLNKKVSQHGTWLTEEKASELYTWVNHQCQHTWIAPPLQALLIDDQLRRDRLIRIVLAGQYLFLDKSVLDDTTQLDAAKADLLVQIGGKLSGHHALGRKILTLLFKLLPILGNMLEQSETISAQQKAASECDKADSPDIHESTFEFSLGFSAFAKAHWAAATHRLFTIPQHANGQSLQAKGGIFIGIAIFWFFIGSRFLIIPLRLLQIFQDETSVFIIYALLSWLPVIILVVLGIKYLRAGTKRKQEEPNRPETTDQIILTPHIMETPTQTLTGIRVNKIINVNLTGGIIGLLGVSPKNALSAAIKRENHQGWMVKQIMPAASGNLFLLVLRLVILVCTLGLYTLNSGYYIVFEREG